MNCEPCNSLEITCNHNVTIGYLKELVALMPTACCSTITVTGDDAYCPTYGELANGSIIPYFSDGGTGAWSNNVDGITISGGYSNNQCVAKKDLKLIYTAFESLTVDNSSPIVSECGGSTTTTKMLTFRKYTKECDKAVSSTTQVDTTLNVTWAGTDGVNTGTKTYSANSSFSDTHPSTVYCTISWRGCSYTSNSITVSQSVRAFDHNVDYARDSGTSVDVTCYPREFDCVGGTSYAAATYYYTTWTERHYIDTCGVDYYQENINITDRNMDVSSYLNATAHTYECQVTTADQSRFYFTATYNGLSDSDYCQQVCSKCESCPPAPFTSYTDVEVACSAGSARVESWAYSFTGGSIDGQGNCTGWTSSRTDVSYDVTWNCSTNGGWLDDHVYVTGAPCCSTSTAYTFDDVSTQCEAENSHEVTVAWTCVVHNVDGTTTTTTGSSPKTIPAHGCNATNNTVELQSRIVAETAELARPRVIQAAGPCCPTGDVFTYNDVTVDCYEAAATTMSVGYTQVHTNPDGTTTTTTGTNPNTPIPARQCNPDTSSRQLQAGSTGTTLEAASPKVMQAGGTDCCGPTCTPTSCTCYIVSNATASTVSSTATAATVTWQYTAVTWTTAATCDVSSSSTINTASTAVTFVAATCDDYTKNGSFAWTGYKGCTSSSACTSSDVIVNWSVPQTRPAGCDCTCADLSITTTSLVWSSWDDVASKTTTYSANDTCITDVTVSSSDNWFSVSVNTSTKVITITPAGQNTTSSAKSSLITISYKSNGTSCSKIIEVEQPRQPACNCDNLTFTKQS